MARISASDISSAFLLFQLLANLGSFLTGTKDITGAAAGALGKKLDLAAVEATAGGKEGTVIWARRAEGRVARTNCSGAAAGLAAAVSTGDWTGSTGVTLIDFTEDGFAVLVAGAGLAALATVGRVVLAATAVLEAARDAGANLTGAVFLAAVVWVELALDGEEETAISLAGNLTGAALDAGVFLTVSALPEGFVLFGVFTSCLLAVSKGRILTVCPRAADPKPVHVLFKPLL